jgi:hypothetical protein
MRSISEGGVRYCLFTTLGMALAAGLLAGCTSTYQARKTTTTGFLGNYSQLKPGKGEEALLVYVNPKADFKKYDKIILDPVSVYATPNSSLAKLSKEDRQRLVNYLDATLREHLKADYTIVTAAGPGVMRVRVAITEAKGAMVAMDTLSTVMPIGLALSEVKSLATGSHAAVGVAGVECEGLDSVSKERLFAAVDKRVGQKVTGKLDKFDKWRTPNDAFDYWADRLQQRLKEERSKGAAKGPSR